VAPEGHERRALGTADLLEEVGDVGLVQVVEQRDEAVVIAGLDGGEHRVHRLAVEPVLLALVLPLRRGHPLVRLGHACLHRAPESRADLTRSLRR
jgi:hypothetical protein